MYVLTPYAELRSTRFIRLFVAEGAHHHQYSNDENEYRQKVHHQIDPQAMSSGLHYRHNIFVLGHQLGLFHWCRCWLGNQEASEITPAGVKHPKIVRCSFPKYELNNRKRKVS